MKTTFVCAQSLGVHKSIKHGSLRCANSEHNENRDLLERQKKKLQDSFPSVPCMYVMA